DQAELGDRQDPESGAILRELRLETLEDLVAMSRVQHVDEVHDEESAEISQADLPRDLRDRLEVRGEHRLLEVFFSDVLAGVDVDGHESLGLVDHDRAARRERYPALQGVLDFGLDAERVEERLRIPMQVEAVDER